jgi:hypothetical protein
VFGGGADREMDRSHCRTTVASANFSSAPSSSSISSLADATRIVPPVSTERSTATEVEPGSPAAVIVEFCDRRFDVLVLGFEGADAIAHEHGVDAGLDRCELALDALIEVHKLAGEALTLVAVSVLAVQTHRVGTAPLACRRFRQFVALVRAGSKFENGVLVERPDESASGETHAA